MVNTIKRGEIYFAELDPVIGSEQAGYRPVVILQNDVGNHYSPTVIVAPLTTKSEKAKLPTHICIEAFKGLEENSTILIEQIRTIDKKRLSIYLGKLQQHEMKAIEKAINISLEISKIG